MDVQKQDDLIKEAFEIEAEEIGFCLDQLWGDYENPYENSDTALAFNLFKKGWLAKAQAVPEWISVGDSLPPVDETVLVCWDYAADIEPEKEYLTLDEDYNEYWPNCQDEPPTHWLPLPKVIKAQEPTND